MTGSEQHGIYQFFAGISAPLAGLFVAPFVLLLLSIAVLPLVAGHFWEKNRNKAVISLIFGLPVAAFFIYNDWNVFARTALEYGAFIALLGALFVVSGGVYIKGSFTGMPTVNTVFLAVGALLANFIGTTGASMLLIRPLIRANAGRRHKAHTIIFFIFVVSNCGGLLTPLGDPPLFLGFLKGVSFGWTLVLFKEFLFVVAALLFIYFMIDRFFWAREPEGHREPFRLTDPVLSRHFSMEGRRNFFFLFLVISVSLFSGYVLYRRPGPMIFNEPFGVALSESFQIVAFALIAFASYSLTPKKVHEQNRFSFHPIIEVAVIFAGIFAAMIPALIILETKGGSLGVDRPWQFFWLTGGLSSFLDNAPTYLTFTSLAKGVLHLAEPGLGALSAHPVGQYYLAAISCGAVFMGANTYIGNGPNFMVKAIAEHENIKMPGFFGYMLWSGLILIPVFIIATFLFFSGRV
jgi:Na+/H+ antiporter NhaD/arsenite permease-like protein